MQKLIFKRNKYGRELLFDTVHSRDFGLEIVSPMVYPSFYTIACLRNSHGSLKVGLEQIALRPNMLVFIPEGQVTNLEQSFFTEGIFIFFEREFLDIFFKEQDFLYKFSFFHNLNAPYHLYLEGSDFEACYNFFEELHQEMHSLRKDSEHAIRSILYYLLIKSNRLYSQTYTIFESGMLTNPYLISFRALLEREGKTNQNVQTYANKLGISRVHLNKLCMAYFQKTATQVIKERLLLEAKKELLYTEKTISEIAYDLNFSAPAHFTRFFKLLTQTTPQAYRQQLSNW